jgi:hypothetical protein
VTSHLLARSRRVPLRTGAVIETPLLVPSFSSRGYPVREDGSSVIVDALQLTAPTIVDAMLVSAYDLGYGLVPGLDGLSSRPATGPLAAPEVLFLDSGGYELQVARFDDPNRHPMAPKDWDETRYDGVLSRVSDDADIVIVNLESHGPIQEQADQARAFFGRHPRMFHDFLIKPSVEYLDPPTITANVRALVGFDIIGVTEKELGTRLDGRLRCLARLRQALDQAGIGAPIHVFGSLDPLMSPMYFLAGAEIFDGLSWLTHAFDSELGLAIYSEAYAVTHGYWAHHERRRRGSIWASNLTERDRVTMQMRTFLLDGDFAAFGPQRETLEAAWNVIRVALAGGGE